MDFSTAAWFSLLAFILYKIPNLPFVDKLNQQEKEFHKNNPPSVERYNSLGKEKYCRDYVKAITPFIRKRKMIHIVGLLGIFCSLVMVLQGIHLWQSWDGLNSPALDKALMKGLIRTRRGGIIALTIQLCIKFLPQFLIVGYGYLIYRHKYLLYPKNWEHWRDKWMDQYR